MSRALFGQWLREERQARGWNVPEIRRRLREAAKESGDNLPANDCLSVMIHRWEDDRSGISERYRLHYCRVFRIPLDQFGQARDQHDEAQPSEHDRPDSQPEPVCVNLAADVRSAIYVACNQAVRGMLAEVISQLGRSLANGPGRAG